MVRSVVYLLMLVVICGAFADNAPMSNKLKEPLPTINLANSSVAQLYVINYFPLSSIPTTCNDLNNSKSADEETEGLDLAMQCYKRCQRRTSEMKIEIKDLQKEVAALREKISTKEKQIINMQARSDSKDEIIAGRDASIKDLLATVSGRDASIKDLQTAFASRDASIKDLQGTVAVRDSSVKDLEQIVKGKNASIENLEKNLIAKDASIRILEKTIAEKNITITNLENYIDGKEATIQTQLAKIDSMKDVLKRHCVVGRDLAIFFMPNEFKLKSPYKVQGRHKSWKVVFVNDSRLKSTANFLEIRETFNNVFVNAGRLRSIGQAVGYTKNGDKAVEVTPVDSGFSGAFDKLEFCDADGTRYESSELERRPSDYIQKNVGKRLPIRDGGCRTSLWIHG